MIKKAIIISALSILAIGLLFGSKFITVEHIESIDRNVDSFSIVSIWCCLIAGVLMMFVAFWTFRVHIVAGIIPFGVGASLVFYCIYLVWCKTL